ncbi:type III PLP-dependent enzyme [Magnetospirillum sp. UT-4]|uniref:type III PLP-dependent enzyme n=1 Tax=Magnetospirillum sp. UT-4 TaxID=2681467 RepID=UPI00138327E7|nr:type III PLP-dependent enzyme [Magnetospirillum sp. UT-4]CAA7613609.1 putative Lysine/ornithine decarboxylase [Magnetospirillum sp. UT-4]
MTHIRFRPVLPTVQDFVSAEQPDLPVHCLRPAVLTRSAEHFVEAFPGSVLYAVKCNPDPAVLDALWAGGVRHFDCASVQEVRLVRRLLPESAIHFMHPVKSRAAIREAWEWHGVRDFVIDSAAELAKVLQETRGAFGELGLVVRLALPKGGAVYDLSGKFGAEPGEAVRLLRMARAVAHRVGLCFHVGSQCLDPAAWERALTRAGRVLDESGVDIDILDVGGGFPVSYPDVEPPPLAAFMAAIVRGVAALDLPAACELWCEPGRALVAAGQSVVVRVEGRRAGHLFVNDGIYGSLSDAGAPGFRFPCRLIRTGGDPVADETTAFSLFGPTCDSADRMEGPFLLPADAREGDWIEIGQLGAYGTSLRTAFNGFDEALRAEVRDPPLLETPGYAALERAA